MMRWELPTHFPISCGDWCLPFTQHKILYAARHNETFVCRNAKHVPSENTAKEGERGREVQQWIRLINITLHHFGFTIMKIPAKAKTNTCPLRGFTVYLAIEIHIYPSSDPRGNFEIPSTWKHIGSMSGRGEQNQQEREARKSQSNVRGWYTRWKFHDTSIERFSKCFIPSVSKNEEGGGVVFDECKSIHYEHGSSPFSPFCSWKFKVDAKKFRKLPKLKHLSHVFKDFWWSTARSTAILIFSCASHEVSCFLTSIG